MLKPWAAGARRSHGCLRQCHPNSVIYQGCRWASICSPPAAEDDLAVSALLNDSASQITSDGSLQ